MVKTNTVILHFMHVYGEKCFNRVEYKLDGAILSDNTEHETSLCVQQHVSCLLLVCCDESYEQR
jgi:hypothetical protein